MQLSVHKLLFNDLRAEAQDRRRIGSENHG
jgi:hypothetical protein